MEFMPTSLMEFLVPESPVAWFIIIGLLLLSLILLQAMKLGNSLSHSANILTILRQNLYTCNSSAVEKHWFFSNFLIPIFFQLEIY